MDELFKKRLKRLAKEISLLIVEDNGLLRDKVKRDIFAPFGFKEIQEERDGRSGLMAFQKGYYDLIVTDFDMPFMTGTEMINRIFSEKGNLPQVLIMTEYPALKSVKCVMREYRTKVMVFDKSIIRGIIKQVSWALMSY